MGTKKKEDDIWFANHFVPIMKIHHNNNTDHQTDVVQSQVLDQRNQIEKEAENEKVYCTSEHERLTEYRPPSTIFGICLVAQSKIDAGVWKYRTEIPPGHKANIMYVTKNFNKGRTGRYKNVGCDYGPWENTVNHDQYKPIPDATKPSLEYVGPKETIDYGLKEDEKVVIKTCRQYLKENKNFQRKITYIKQAPKEFSAALDYCTVEYIGPTNVGPNIKPHGNSKGKDPYKRVNPEVLEIAKEKVKNMSVRDVFRELNDWRHPEKSIPKAKIISNLKANLAEVKALRSGTLADGLEKLDIQKIVNEVKLKFDSYVRHTSTDEKLNPTVICYKPWQIMDMSTNCKFVEGKIISLMSIDTTFGLGPMKCTMFTYQNMNLINKKTKTNPCIAGPTMFHTKSEYETFGDFFSHVRIRQDNVAGRQQYFIISDEERAIVKAIEHAYPDSIHVLCCQHLEEAQKRRLKNADPTAMNRVIHKIFDPVNGLIAASSPRDFEIKEAAIDWSVYEDTDYCLELRKKILKKVVEPRLLSGGIVPVYPTTNTSESMNNMKKIENGFQPHQLPIVVHNADLSATSQEGKIYTTFYGQSEYDLVPAMDHVKKTYEQWANMTETAQVNNFTTFTKGPREPSSTQTSALGTLTINRPTTNIMGKPGANTRIRSTKTTTPRSTYPRETGRGRGKGRPRSQSPSKTPRGRGGGRPSKRPKVGRKVDLAELFRANSDEFRRKLDEQFGSDDEDVE